MASTSVRQMRSAFRAALRRRREVRQAFAQTMRQALREHRAAILASMRPAAGGPGPPVGARRGAPGGGGVARIWTHAC